MTVACGGRPPTRGILAQDNPVRPATPAPGDPRPKAPSSLPPNLTKPMEGTRLVGFFAPDETRLVGRLFGDDGNRALGVLLLHSSSADMRTWFPFAQQLMADGYMVFAFDFRGYGQSEGPKKPVDYPIDVEGGVQVLQLFGASKVAIVGSEVGGTAAVAAPKRWSSLLQGIVTVGSAPTFESLDVTETARSLRERALVLGEGDLGELIPDARQEAVTISSTPEQDDEVTSRIVDFIGEVLEG